MLHVVLVEVLFVDNCLSIEETFRKRVVLPLYPLSFFLSDTEIQTSWLINPVLRRRCAFSHSSWSWNLWNWRPFTIWDVNKFAQQDLVLAADDDILFWLLELLRLFLLGLELLQVGLDLPSLLRLDNPHRVVAADGLADLRDLVELLLVYALVTATQDRLDRTQWLRSLTSLGLACFRGFCQSRSFAWLALLFAI